MQATLNRLAASGDLPLHPFEEGSRDSLLVPLADPLDDYFALLAQSGSPQPQQEIRLTAGPLPLEDWLTDLRGATANPQRLVRRPASWKTVTTSCVATGLPGRLCTGYPLTTRIQGQDGRFTLLQVTQQAAQQHLDQLGHAWQQALCHPLPVACATICFLTEEDEEKGGKRQAPYTSSDFSVAKWMTVTGAPGGFRYALGTDKRETAVSLLDRTTLCL